MTQKYREELNELHRQLQHLRMEEIKVQARIQEIMLQALSEVKRQPEDGEKLLNIKKCAEFLGISPSYLSKYPAMYPHVKIGDRRFYIKSELIKHLKQN